FSLCKMHEPITGMRKGLNTRRSYTRHASALWIFPMCNCLPKRKYSCVVRCHSCRLLAKHSLTRECLQSRFTTRYLVRICGRKTPLPKSDRWFSPPPQQHTVGLRARTRHGSASMWHTSKPSFVVKTIFPAESMTVDRGQISYRPRGMR